MPALPSDPSLLAHLFVRTACFQPPHADNRFSNSRLNSPLDQLSSRRTDSTRCSSSPSSRCGKGQARVLTGNPPLIANCLKYIVVITQNTHRTPFQSRLVDCFYELVVA